MASPTQYNEEKSLLPSHILADIAGKTKLGLGKMAIQTKVRYLCEEIDLVAWDLQKLSIMINENK